MVVKGWISTVTGRERPISWIWGEARGFSTIDSPGGLDNTQLIVHKDKKLPGWAGLPGDGVARSDSGPDERLSGPCF